MKKEIENFFFEQLPADKGLNEHTSVSSGADNGANNCMSKGYQNSMRHDTTRKAVDNLKIRLASRVAPINLCGHGCSGSLETGSGQSGWEWDKIINSWNLYDWKPMLSELCDFNFPILSIISCSTGAGEEGADLLWDLAKTINKPVRARTGLTYCGNGAITYQPGSTWQTAHPEARPNPIPETHKKIVMKMAQIHLISDDKKIWTTGANNIISAKIHYLGLQTVSNELPILKAKQIGAIIFNESLQKLPGQVTGFLTMQFDFEINVNKKTTTLHVDIFNDNVAVIISQNIMYYLPSLFRSLTY